MELEKQTKCNTHSCCAFSFLRPRWPLGIEQLLIINQVAYVCCMWREGSNQPLEIDWTAPLLFAGEQAAFEKLNHSTPRWKLLSLSRYKAAEDLESNQDLLRCARSENRFFRTAGIFYWGVLKLLLTNHIIHWNNVYFQNWKHWGLEIYELDRPN